MSDRTDRSIRQDVLSSQARFDYGPPGRSEAQVRQRPAAEGRRLEGVEKVLTDRRLDGRAREAWPSGGARRLGLDRGSKKHR